MNRIKRILCPIDLSEESSESLRYAAALSRAYNARLIFLYCASSSPDGSPLSQAAIQDLNGMFTNAITRHIDRLDIASLDWEGAVTECDDDPAEAIAREASDNRIDLIVMQSRRLGLRDTTIGSVTEAVCRTAPAPVLVTHAHEHEGTRSGSGEIYLKRVLVAYDFSDGSERALGYALSLGRPQRAELHLLSVLSTPAARDAYHMWGPSNTETLYHNTMRRLQKAAPRGSGCNIVSAVRWGRPSDEIVDYTREHSLDLVCIGAHGLDFGIQSLFGSNVGRVLRQTSCPVLVARPRRVLSLEYEKTRAQNAVSV
jgi:nucleotide-binding universal stress UspA family protein